MREPKKLFEDAEAARNSSAKPKYVPPAVVTYDKDEIIELIGPALACESEYSCATSFA